jgi:hypothetical protein
MIAAGRIVGYLAPIAMDKAVELAQEVGKSAVDNVADWLDKLRARWSDDDEATSALAAFEQDPEDNAEQLQAVLADRMEKDETLRASAEQLAKNVGPMVVVTMKGGHVDVQEGPEFGNVLRGKVSVNIGLEKGTIQRGPRFGDIG